MVLIELELSNEAFEEVRDKCIAAGLIVDEPREWDQDSKPFTVGGTTFKEWKYVPKPEEIARQEEYRKTPLGQLMEKFIAHGANRFLDDLLKPNYLLDGVDTAGMKFDTSLRIRLPNGYSVTNDPAPRPKRAWEKKLSKDHFVNIGSEWLDK